MTLSLVSTHSYSYTVDTDLNPETLKTRDLNLYPNGESSPPIAGVLYIQEDGNPCGFIMDEDSAQSSELTTSDLDHFSNFSDYIRGVFVEHDIPECESIEGLQKEEVAQILREEKKPIQVALLKPILSTLKSTAASTGSGCLTGLGTAEFTSIMGFEPLIKVDAISEKAAGGAIGTAATARLVVIGARAKIISLTARAMGYAAKGVKVLSKRQKIKKVANKVESSVKMAVTGASFVVSLATCAEIYYYLMSEDLEGPWWEKVLYKFGIDLDD